MSNQTIYDLATLRTEFPLVERFTYLNHAGISPLPKVAQRAVDANMEFLAEPCGQGKDFGAAFTAAHTHISALINGQREGIAMVQNTAEGMNIAAHALPLQAGDNVLVCDQEYPAVAYPFLNLSKLKGIETRVLANDRGGTSVELLERNADARTRAVAVSSVEFATGFRTDLVA